MQNKANFQKGKMNVSRVSTKDCEDETLGQRGKNKPNSNPIQTQSNPIKANKMPKQSQYKPKQSQFQRQKKCCSPPLCCGISKEKMIFCNLINRKYQFNIIAGKISNNKTI